MNYIGSKHSLLDFLETSILQVVGNDNSLVFCDLFAGTGAVGRNFKKLGYKVIANDVQYYSYVLNRHYIGNHKPMIRIETLIKRLNNLDGIDGFISQNYAPNEKCERKYFTVENARKCDAIRQQIEQWKSNREITEDEYFCLLATLLECIDKYANTASVYGAYLKDYKKSARKTMQLEPLPVFVNEKEHKIFNEDCNTLIREIAPDILYLDPPYNTRQYSANYHLLETIAKNDNPEIIGKTGLRKNKENSLYCSRQAVKKQFSDLIANAKAKYIFLSYNNEGLLSPDYIKEIMRSRGEYGVFTKEYSRFKADNNRDYKDSKTTEYLHYVICK